MAKAPKRGGGGETARAREMRAVLREWERSGLRLTEFARQRAVPLSTLTWWRHQLRQRRSVGKRTRAVRFVELRQVSPPAPVAPFEVVLPDRTVIRVGAQFDPAALEQLVKTLARC
jgi:hypothetical protein